MTTKAPKPIRTWLWPDHLAGKRETRLMREEHNHAINQMKLLREALSECVEWDAMTGFSESRCWKDARKILETTRELA